MSTTPDPITAALHDIRDGWMSEYAVASHYVARAVATGNLNGADLAPLVYGTPLWPAGTYEPPASALRPTAVVRAAAQRQARLVLGTESRDLPIVLDCFGAESLGVAAATLFAIAAGDISDQGISVYDETLERHGLDYETLSAGLRGSLVEAAERILAADVVR